MDTTVVIPQFGQPELTARCVDSLRQHERARWPVLVVDDGSPHDQQRLAVKQETATDRFVSVRHRGVTAAWNVGLQLAETDYAVLLNNDVVFRGPALEALLQPLRDGRAFLAGVAWRTERHWPAALESTLPSRRLLAGWCWAMSRSLWQKLGGFDTALALYFSDTDFQLRCLQARNAGDGESSGDELACVEGLPLVHAGHVSTRRLDDRRQQWERDRRRFLEKWG